MINARRQVADALLTVCENVKMSRPEGDVELPLICYAETYNNPINIAYDRIKWRVAVYAGTFAELVRLTAAADNVMSEVLGWTRTGKSSDESSRIGTDLYLCKLDYSGIVKKDTLTIIRGSV